MAPHRGFYLGAKYDFTKYVLSQGPYWDVLPNPRPVRPAAWEARGSLRLEFESQALGTSLPRLH